MHFGSMRVHLVRLARITAAGAPRADEALGWPRFLQYSRSWELGAPSTWRRLLAGGEELVQVLRTATAVIQLKLDAQTS